MMPIPIWFPYSATWSVRTPSSTRLGAFLKSRRSVQHNSLIGFVTVVVVGHRQLSWTYPSSSTLHSPTGFHRVHKDSPWTPHRLSVNSINSKGCLPYLFI